MNSLSVYSSSSSQHSPNKEQTTSNSWISYNIFSQFSHCFCNSSSWILFKLATLICSFCLCTVEHFSNHHDGKCGKCYSEELLNRVSAQSINLRNFAIVSCLCKQHTLYRSIFLLLCFIFYSNRLAIVSNLISFFR
jgi:hypothetical protein